jgi:SEC-C motif
MRLSEHKIKEAIPHPDMDVRDTAIRYFYSSTRPDDTLMPLAIQAIERYGPTKAFSFTHYLNLLPQTEDTIGWVIAELQRDVEGRPDERHFYYLNLSRLLSHADIRLIAQHAPDILHAPHFDSKEQVAFRERLEMFGWNAEKCWQELHQYCDANKDKNNLEEFDLGHALRIVEALARQPHEYQGQIVALLAEQVRDFRHDDRKWLQPLMANLAGAMRLKEAIPPLVGNLGHPYSFLADQSMFALAKIGSDDVVAAVCDQYPRGSKDFRLWASDLLCKIHLDSTVRRVQELLSGETDLAVRLNLCEALLDHFSDEGIEPASRLIKEQQLTPDLRRLRSSLIAVCKIMGSRFPEFDVWQEQAKNDAHEEWAKSQEIQKLAFEAGGDLGLLVRKLKAQVAEKELERKRLEAEVAKHERLLAARPSPRPVVGPTRPGRIGRNDPCPCGSGKKFKHCCMRT